MNIRRFKTHKDAWINVNLTHLQGTLDNVPYDELVEIFGEPIIDPMDEKVTCYWDIEFFDGTIATLYNYYPNCPPEYEKNWHIGGHRFKAVGRIRQAIDLHRIGKAA